MKKILIMALVMVVVAISTWADDIIRVRNNYDYEMTINQVGEYGYVESSFLPPNLSIEGENVYLRISQVKPGEEVWFQIKEEPRNLKSG
ncbi:hypothetical protein AGMMS49944_21480 [Spirochaetia bacterium]|nr:hypothetical protein AGMMS49944_21480 [Spirochaetia bacterium]